MAEGQPPANGKGEEQRRYVIFPSLPNCCFWHSHGEIQKGKGVRGQEKSYILSAGIVCRWGPLSNRRTNADSISSESLWTFRRYSPHCMLCPPGCNSFQVINTHVLLVALSWSTPSILGDPRHTKCPLGKPLQGFSWMELWTAPPVLSFLGGPPWTPGKHAFFTQVSLGAGDVSNTPLFSFFALQPLAESTSLSPEPTDTAYVSQVVTFRWHNSHLLFPKKWESRQEFANPFFLPWILYTTDQVMVPERSPRV